MLYENKKRLKQNAAFWMLRILTFTVLLILFIILGFIVEKGFRVLSWDFITKMPEDGMTKGGIYPAIIGTLILMLGSMIIAFPIGVMSGIYMNEYVKDGIFKRFMNVMTSNLAGIPSIVFGLFGMEFFVNELKWGDSILAGSFTLGLLALPVVIRVCYSWICINSTCKGGCEDVRNDGLGKVFLTSDKVLGVV